MMFRRKIFSILLNAVYFQNVLCQILPIGSGCGCQQLPVQQNLPVPIQVANNCGCRNNLLANLPNGIQINNNLQIAKSLPCGCANNLQYLQNLLTLGNGLQLSNGMPLANPLSQDLALVNSMPLPGCQNMLQVSLQTLLNQLSQQQNCQCGQSLAPTLGNSIINSNLLGVNGMQKAISNLPCQSVANLQVVTGQQEVVLGNPYSCQPCQNVVSNSCPCQSCQNIVSNPCPCQTCQNIVSGPCQSRQNLISNPCPCQSCQNIVSNPCQCQNIISNPCQASQNIISNPCSCQSSQTPMQFTIYQ